MSVPRRRPDGRVSYVGRPRIGQRKPVETPATPIAEQLLEPPTEGEFTEVPADPSTALARSAPAIELMVQVDDRCPLLTMDPEDPIWERLRGESLVWYSRFRSWLGMEPGKRRILTTYKVEYERHYPGKRPPRSAPNTWRSSSIYYRWEERAQAYDKSMRTLRADEMRAQILEERQNRVATLKIARGRVVQRVGALSDQEIAVMAPAAAISLLLAINKELRAEQEGQASLSAIEATDAEGNTFKAYFDIDVDKV